MTSGLAQLLASGWCSALDGHAGHFLERLAKLPCPQLGVVAALASRATRQGHTCLSLSTVPAELREAGLEPAAYADTEQLRAVLLASGMIGRPGSGCPLILDDCGRVYLLRYFREEQAVAQALLARTQGLEPIDQARARQLLLELFPPQGAGQAAVDWQRTAAALALIKRFVVITGGPGSGKTYTVARIVAIMLGLTSRTIRIGLAAPTGKAALRLQESIRLAKQSLPAGLAALVPDQAQTLHRLLRFQPGQQQFLHHRGNPLHLDLLIADEASMVDISLMASLLDALPPTCRLILLGDRDQLASVEAGNLLGDICGQGGARWSSALCQQLEELTDCRFACQESEQAIDDSLVMLQQSFRFAQESGIARFAQAVTKKDPAELAAFFERPEGDARVVEVAGSAMIAALTAQITQMYAPLFTATSPKEALQLFSAHRILCALREGGTGVEGINALAEQQFRQSGRLAVDQRAYPGLPLMILHNDYNVGLFNGDTGIFWPDGQGALPAWFWDESGEVRAVPAASLPAWQPAFAMTVHKAQGSEFEHVALVLPQEDKPILTVELLYTAVTRARKSLTVYAGREILHQAMLRRVIRYSGLASRLRQEIPAASCR